LGENLKILRKIFIDHFNDRFVPRDCFDTIIEKLLRNHSNFKEVYSVLMREWGIWDLSTYHVKFYFRREVERIRDVDIKI
jgi:hypothetical protein